MTDPTSDSPSDPTSGPGSDVSDDDLRALLRTRDPAASLAPATPEEVARLVESTTALDPATASETELAEETRADGMHRRSALTWLVAASAVLLIGVGATFGLSDRGADDPGDVPSAGDTSEVAPATVTELGVGPAADARCLPPEVGLLREQDLAVDATVTSVSGGVVTLEPSRFFIGPPTDLVTVQAPGEELTVLLAAVEFREGERYLVSATEGRVTLCGFSAPFSETLGALYDEAYGG